MAQHGDKPTLEDTGPQFDYHHRAGSSYFTARIVRPQKRYRLSVTSMTAKNDGPTEFRDTSEEPTKCTDVKESVMLVDGCRQ